MRKLGRFIGAFANVALLGLLLVPGLLDHTYARLGFDEVSAVPANGSDQ